MDLSTITEPQIVIENESTAKKYSVVVETINLEALRREKEALEAQLAEKEPSEEELVEWAKETHDYYFNKPNITKRIEEIDSILD